VTAWHKTLVKGQKSPGKSGSIAIVSPAGSTTVVLHKHTEERMVKMREAPGIRQQSDKGGDEEKKRDLGMDLSGVVEIEINSQLGRLLDWGRNVVENSLPIIWRPRHRVQKCSVVVNFAAHCQRVGEFERTKQKIQRKIKIK
jgi:hypothetical protein